jgi:thiazole synthase ThiGH ThiG subunit
MKTRSRALLIATAVVIATAAAFMAINPSIATKTSQEAPQIKSYPKLAGTWTYLCEIPVQRPEEIMLTCADGGMIVTDITWTTWTSKQALGTGIYSQNMCEPSCAEGTREDVPVTIKLSGPFEHKGRNVLKTLDIQAAGRRELPNGGTNMTWDVAEFAVRMNWNIVTK